MKGKNDIKTTNDLIFVLSTMLYSVCEAVGIDEDTSMKIKFAGEDSGEDGIFEISVGDAILRAKELSETKS